MKIGLLGLGTIGSGIYEHLLKRDDIEVVRILELKRHPADSGCGRQGFQVIQEEREREGKEKRLHSTLQTQLFDFRQETESMHCFLQTLETS